MKNILNFVWAFILALVLFSNFGFAQSTADPVNPQVQPETTAGGQEPEPSNDDSGDQDLEDDQESDSQSPGEETPDEKKTPADDKKSDDKKSEQNNAAPEQSDGDDHGAAEPKKESNRFSFGNSSAAADAYSKRSEDFISIFKPIIASAATSTVKIMSGRRQLALGVVVDTEGYILTKASELKGELSCKFADGRSAPAKVFGIHPETDLAMLKIDLDKLNVIQWSNDPAPVVGQWLATPNGQKNTLDVGIVGVNARVIPPSDPFIGIGPPLSVGDVVGAQINSVVADSPADDADLMVGDIITHIDDVAIKDWDSLRATLGQYDANDRITLTLTRAKKEMKIKLTLAERDKVSPQNERSNQQNSMGSVLSRRRKNFPSAFQHDSMLTSTTCGGPIVNLDGRVVGINIARAGRVDSLALPVQSILPVIALLKTGELAPQIVNKTRLVEIDVELKELQTKMVQLPDKKSALETQYQVEKAKQEELEKILKDVQDRLNVIELKSKNFGAELDSVKNELKHIEKIRQRLEADRKQLSTGLR